MLSVCACVCVGPRRARGQDLPAVAANGWDGRPLRGLRLPQGPHYHHRRGQGGQRPVPHHPGHRWGPGCWFNTGSTLIRASLTFDSLLLFFFPPQAISATDTLAQTRRRTGVKVTRGWTTDGRRSQEVGEMRRQREVFSKALWTSGLRSPPFGGLFYASSSHIFIPLPLGVAGSASSNPSVTPPWCRNWLSVAVAAEPPGLPMVLFAQRLCSPLNKLAFGYETGSELKGVQPRPCGCGSFIHNEISW